MPRRQALCPSRSEVAPTFIRALSVAPCVPAHEMIRRRSSALGSAARKVDQYAARKVIHSEGGSLYVLLLSKKGIGLWECGNLAFSSEISKLLWKSFCDFHRSVISTATFFVVITSFGNEIRG